MGQIQGTDAEHPASGVAAVSGHELSFANTMITEAPDAQVWLTKKFDKPNGVNLGSLKSFNSDQSYTIPESVAPQNFDSVVIWCDEFSVPIAKAEL
ncbi:MAG: DM13 domain-containing protein [Rubripirellula sp.]